MMTKISLIYCTGSDYKIEEWQVISTNFKVTDLRGRNASIGELFDLRIQSAKLREPLLCDLADVVREKAVSAYESVRVPCLVEHAGLVFDELKDHSYPGGLTQPMWDALEAERFVRMKGIAGARVIAKAIIGYCDGMKVHVFEGETQGVISGKPRGKRVFYWDSVFCPDGGGDRTYAEIADESDGLVAKMEISQSKKAFMKFLEYRLRNEPKLFS